MLSENKLIEYYKLLKEADWRYRYSDDRRDYKRGEESVKRAMDFRERLIKEFPGSEHIIVSLWNLAKAR